MMGNGQTMLRAVRVLSFIKLETNILEIGEMIYRTGSEIFIQLMEQSMRVNGSMEKKRVRAIINFQMVTIMRANGKMIK